MDGNMSDLVEKIREKQYKKNIVHVKKLPDHSTLKELTIVGTYSYFQNTSQRRIIDIKKSIKIENGLYETPPSIARTYLFGKYKLAPRISKKHFEQSVQSLRPVPNYAAPCVFGNGFYIDIKSAYFSIMKIVGWDVDYIAEKWLTVGTPPDDFPFQENKIAKVCLYSAGSLSGMPTYAPDWKMRGWDNSVKPMPQKNLLASPMLHKLTSDVLNSIAALAVEAGAVYANTDGFIAPDEFSAGHIVDIITNWGLECTLKGEGPGGVKGSGAYKVGTMVSMPYAINNGDTPINKIYRPRHLKWLERAFGFWARENH